MSGGENGVESIRGKLSSSAIFSIFFSRPSHNIRRTMKLFGGEGHAAEKKMMSVCKNTEKNEYFIQIFLLLTILYKLSSLAFR